MSKEWASRLNAQMYERYVEAFPYYPLTSSRLIELAGIRQGMTVVDLACGTGIVTRQVLPKVGTNGMVIGIDRSPAVLHEAQRVIQAPNAKFIQSPAEKLDDVIPVETVDEVLCNSAFWKCEPAETLHAVNHALKTNGKFVFNIVENYIKENAQWQLATSFPQLMLQVARERGVPFPPRKIKKLFIGEQSIDNLIQGSSLTLVSHEPFTVQRRPDEVYEFFKIPAMLEIYFPAVDYEALKPVLEEAYERFDKTITYPEVWIYYVLQKRPNLSQYRQYGNL